MLAFFFCDLLHLTESEFSNDPLQVIDTLLPSGTSNDAEITTGQCICTAILSSETVQVRYIYGNGKTLYETAKHET